MLSLRARQVGYVRSTTNGGALQQREALMNSGCCEVYEDRGAQAKALNRPGLKKALSALQEGDQLVVCRLDCIGWSLGYLARLIDDLARRRVGFRSLQESLDTNDQSGPFFLRLMANLVEFERAVWTEHTRGGLAIAEARGRRPGRKLSMGPQTIRRALKLLEQGKTQEEVAELVGVSRATLNRRLGPTRRVLRPRN